MENLSKTNEIINTAIYNVTNKIPCGWTIGNLDLFMQFKNILEHEKEKLHLFNISKEITNSLLLTNNEVKLRKMPFKNIFLETNIKIGNMEIYGVHLSEYCVNLDKKKFIEDKLKKSLKDIECDEERMIKKWDIICELDKDHTLFSNDSNYDHKMISWQLVGNDYNDDTVFLLSGAIGKDNRLKIFEKITNFKIEDIEEIKPNISLFICNFLDFLNDPDVNLIKVERDENKNNKRVKRGKLSIFTSFYIRLKGELKIYFDKLQSDLAENKFNHRFWVRGHYKHWRSDKFKNVKGKKTWVKPYIKGQGILIDKQYIVHKP